MQVRAAAANGFGGETRLRRGCVNPTMYTGWPRFDQSSSHHARQSLRLATAVRAGHAVCMM
jgi:hypothetical protein